MDQLPVGAVKIITTPVLPKKMITDFKTLQTLEIEHIELALSKFENKARVAEALGITVKTLYNKLHAYGLFEKYKA